MSCIYIKNNLGFAITPEEMEKIERPKTELTIHVTARVTQAFIMLGTLIVAPIAAFSIKDTRNMKGLLKRVKQCGIGGAVAGIVVGNILIYNFMKPLQPEEIYDRTYRIRKNRGQVNVDRALVLGTAGGMALGAASTVGVALGGVGGVVGGVFAATAFNAAFTNAKK